MVVTETNPPATSSTSKLQTGDEWATYPIPSLSLKKKNVAARIFGMERNEMHPPPVILGTPRVIIRQDFRFFLYYS
jgi:hypothetical protein